MRKIVAIAIAEIRSARRLARTWTFAGLALAVGIVQFIFFSFMHGTASGMSASAGLISPRFILSYLGVYYVWVLMVGLVFLAFDVRARDERDRIAEVVDARPASNLALLSGRLAGLVLVAWAPVLALAVLFQAIGAAAKLFDWPMGEMVQPVSLTVFLFLDALPVLILWCATIILLAVALRYRLLIVVAGLALFGLHVYSADIAPVYLWPLILPFGSAYPSDILPAYPDLMLLAHRASLLLFAAGALLLAAVLYPRPDGAFKPARAGAGIACIVVSAAMLGLMFANAADRLTVTEQWAQAHESRRDDPHADVEKVAGFDTHRARRNLGARHRDACRRALGPRTRGTAVQLQSGHGSRCGEHQRRDDDVLAHGRDARRRFAGAARSGFASGAVLARAWRSGSFLRLSRQRDPTPRDWKRMLPGCPRWDRRSPCLNVDTSP